MLPPDSPHDDAPPGNCRWCGKDVFKRNGRIDFKSNWHKECRDEMKLVHDDALMRKHIWNRDRGNCAECSAKCGLKGWEVHYVDLPSDFPDELEPWKPDNLETLCWKCWKIENGPPVEEPEDKFIYRQSRFD